MYDLLLMQRATIAGVAAIAGSVSIVTAVRARRCGENATPRFAIGACAFLIAALVALRDLAPIVAYSILCLALAMVFLADLLEDERARRRRLALLAPRPVADVVPMAWIAITILSTLTFVPYVLGGIDSGPAWIAAACTIAMAAIAWRVASAPTQITGEDPEEDPRSEQIRDRVSRARRAGLTCVVAIGSVALFLNFVDAPPPEFGGLGRITGIEMLAVWAVLWAWQALYARRIARTAQNAA